MLQHPLHLEAVDRFHKVNSATVSFIETLQKIDSQRLYLDWNFSSLWDYLVAGIKMSNHEAYQYSSVCRASVKVPALKEAIREGTITFPTAALITPEIKPENQEVWLERAERLTTKDLKIELAIAKGKEPQIEIKFKCSPEDYATLQRALDILSQRKRRPVLTAEAVITMASELVEKQAPEKRAERLLRANKVKSQPIPEGRVALPRWIEQTVDLRDQGQCTAVLPNGQRCQNRRFIQRHHRVHLAHGGSNHPDNLRLLCSGHHRGKHREPNHGVRFGLAPCKQRDTVPKRSGDH